METPKHPQSSGINYSKSGISSRDQYWKLVSIPLSLNPKSSETFIPGNYAWIEKKAPMKGQKSNAETAYWIGSDILGISSPGDYTYETQFDYPDAAGLICDASLSFGYAADDYVKDIQLNGEKVYSCSNGCSIEYIKLHKMTVNGLIQGSSNKLQFIVHNGGSKPNSAGFLFQYIDMSVSPDACKKVKTDNVFSEIMDINVNLNLNTAVSDMTKIFDGSLATAVTDVTHILEGDFGPVTKDIAHILKDRNVAALAGCLLSALLLFLFLCLVGKKKERSLTNDSSSDVGTNGTIPKSSHIADNATSKSKSATLSNLPANSVEVAKINKREAAEADAIRKADEDAARFRAAAEALKKKKLEAAAIEAESKNKAKEESSRIKTPAEIEAKKKEDNNLFIARAKAAVETDARNAELKLEAEAAGKKQIDDEDAEKKRVEQELALKKKISLEEAEKKLKAEKEAAIANEAAEAEANEEANRLKLVAEAEAKQRALDAVNAKAELKRKAELAELEIKEKNIQTELAAAELEANNKAELGAVELKVMKKAGSSAAELDAKSKAELAGAELEAMKKAGSSATELEVKKKTELAAAAAAELEVKKKAELAAAELEAKKKAELAAAELEAKKKADLAAAAAAAAELEAKKKAELAAAELEAKKKADLAAAELEVKKKAELAAAELEAKKKAELAAAELEAKKKAELAAAELEVKKKAELAAAELEAKKKAELVAAEAKTKAELAAAELVAKTKAELAAAELEAKKKAELVAAEAKTKAELAAAELEAKKKAELAAAELEAKKKAELAAAELEAKKKADFAAAELAAKKKAELAAAEAKTKAELAAAELEAKKKVDEASALLKSAGIKSVAEASVLNTAAETKVNEVVKEAVVAQAIVGEVSSKLTDEAAVLKAAAASESKKKADEYAVLMKVAEMEAKKDANKALVVAKAAAATYSPRTGDDISTVNTKSAVEPISLETDQDLSFEFSTPMKELPTSITAASVDKINTTSVTGSVSSPPPLLDAFVRRLRQTGFKVERIKNNVASDQNLHLNNKGYLVWSKSMFSNSQPISTLESVFEADDGFILAFKSKKTVQFKMKESEFPFNAAAMITYFNAIIKKIESNPNYVDVICSNQQGVNDADDDADNDAASVATDGVGALSPNPRDSISGSTSGRLSARRPSFSSFRLPSFLSSSSGKGPVDDDPTIKLSPTTTINETEDTSATVSSPTPNTLISLIRRPSFGSFRRPSLKPPTSSLNTSSDITASIPADNGTSFETSK